MNPWTITGERRIYDNQWIGVTEYDVINPNGGKGIYGKIFYKNLAIGVLPLDEDGYTWLVGQYRFPLDLYSWELPEGGGDPALPPVVSAQRELEEETGLVASDWSLLMEMHLSNSVTDERAFVFLARGLEQREAMPEETEQLAVRRVSLDEVYAMVEKGEITDSISVAAIYKVKLMLVTGELKLNK